MQSTVRCVTVQSTLSDIETSASVQHMFGGGELSTLLCGSTAFCAVCNLFNCILDMTGIQAELV